MSTMREIIARVVCGVTLVVVLALAWVFAWRHNPAQRAPSASRDAAMVEGRVATPDVERGRLVYEEQGCASCHAIGGRGNPRYPLDGVGDRRNAAQLRDYVTASAAAAEELSAAIVSRKTKYRAMPAAELDALIAYLASLSRTTAR